MIVVTLNINNLNPSLQVGDLVYKTETTTQTGANDPQNSDPLTAATSGQGYTFSPVGNLGLNLVGVLSRITVSGNEVTLDIDETNFFNTVIPNESDYLMFSKYSQTDGDVIGYYAQAKFTNNSRDKAELFSVGSEVVINSK
tara:strand:- start:12 stop:434 length:423 start_codon:yes stop_codon:yes gene_type:complete